MALYKYVCCTCVFIRSVFNITVAIDLLQNAFGVDVADKTQVDLYKLEEPLEVCNTFLKEWSIIYFTLITLCSSDDMVPKDGVTLVALDFCP